MIIKWRKTDNSRSFWLKRPFFCLFTIVACYGKVIIVLFILFASKMAKKGNGGNEPLCHSFIPIDNTYYWNVRILNSWVIITHIKEIIWDISFWLVTFVFNDNPPQKKENHIIIIIIISWDQLGVQFNLRFFIQLKHTISHQVMINDKVLFSINQ